MWIRLYWLNKTSRCSVATFVRSSSWEARGEHDTVAVSGLSLFIQAIFLIIKIKWKRLTRCSRRPYMLLTSQLCCRARSLVMAACELLVCYWLHCATICYLKSEKHDESTYYVHTVFLTRQNFVYLRQSCRREALQRFTYCQNKLATLHCIPAKRHRFLPTMIAMNLGIVRVELHGTCWNAEPLVCICTSLF